MKLFFIFSFFGLSSILFSQDITYVVTSPSTIYADSFDHIYRFHSYLSNNTSDTISLKYVRITKDIMPSNIYNSLCTDILCYFVSQDSIMEQIPPNTKHKIESRWQVISEDIDSGRGYSEWELSLNDPKIIVDTFKTEFIYNKKSTATNDLYLEELSVNPNPVADYIRFSEADLEDLKIFFINGQLVLSSKLLNGSELKVSELNAGQYIGVAKKGSQRFNFRFVKS